jgi:dephospho-CoA kinase
LQADDFMTRLIIGLTGGIGSGKTMATNRFASLGITIVDADLVSRVIVAPGQPALQDIRAQFGNEVLLDDGSLNRAALRSIVFTHPEARKTLERITHPRIAEEIARQLAASTSPYTILVSPLLFESGQQRFTQRTVLVDTTEALQQSRAAQRDGVSEDHIKAIMAAQMSREERLQRADDVLLNDGNLDHLHQAVDALHQRYLALAAAAN